MNSIMNKIITDSTKYLFLPIFSYAELLDPMFQSLGKGTTGRIRNPWMAASSKQQRPMNTSTCPQYLEQAPEFDVHICFHLSDTYLSISCSSLIVPALDFRILLLLICKGLSKGFTLVFYQLKPCRFYSIRLWYSSDLSIDLHKYESPLT